MADYSALPPWRVTAICAARKLDSRSANIQEQIQMIRQNDEERLQENLAFQAKFNSFDQFDDQVTEQRINIVREFADLKIQRLRTENQLTATFAEEMKRGMTEQYLSFADPSKEDVDSNARQIGLLYTLLADESKENMDLVVREIEGAFQIFKDYLLSSPLMIQAQFLDAERLTNERREQSAQPRSRDSTIVDPTTADYDNFEPWKISALCASRNLKADPVKPPHELAKRVQSPRRNDQTRQKKDDSLQTEYDKWNDSNDPTLAHRIKAAKKRLNFKVKTLADDERYLVKHCGPFLLPQMERFDKFRKDSGLEAAKRVLAPVLDHVYQYTTLMEETFNYFETAANTLQQDFDGFKAAALIRASEIQELQERDRLEKESVTRRSETDKKVEEAARTDTGVKDGQEQPTARLHRVDLASFTARGERFHTEPGDREIGVEVEDAARHKAGREIEAEKQKFAMPVKQTGMASKAALIPESSEYDAEDTIVVDTSRLLQLLPAREGIQAKGKRQQQKQQHESGAENSQAAHPGESQQKATETLQALEAKTPEKLASHPCTPAPRRKATEDPQMVEPARPKAAQEQPTKAIDPTVSHSQGPRQKAAENFEEDAAPAAQISDRDLSVAKPVKEPGRQRALREPAETLENRLAGQKYQAIQALHQTAASKKSNEATHHKTLSRVTKQHKDEVTAAKLRASRGATCGRMEHQHGFDRQVQKAVAKTSNVVQEAARGPPPKTAYDSTFGNLVDDFMTQRVKAMAAGLPLPLKTSDAIAFDRQVTDAMAQRVNAMAAGVPSPPKTSDAIAFDRQIQGAIVRKDKEEERRRKGPRQKEVRALQLNAMNRGGQQNTSERVQDKEAHKSAGEDPISRNRDVSDAASGRASYIDLTTDALVRFTSSLRVPQQNELAAMKFRDSEEAARRDIERPKAFGNPVKSAVGQRSHFIEEVDYRSMPLADVVDAIIAQRVAAEAEGLPAPLIPLSVINFFPKDRVESIIARRVKFNEDRLKKPTPKSLEQAESIKQNKSYQALKDTQGKKGDNEALVSKNRNNPDAASAGTYIELTTDGLIPTSVPALNEDIQLSKGLGLIKTAQSEVSDNQSAIVATTEHPTILDPLKNSVDDAIELKMDDPGTLSTIKRKRTLSAGALESPIIPKKVCIDPTDTAPLPIPTKMPLFKAMKQFLVANPCDPLHNPHIFIGLMRPSTEADLKRTWEYILKEAPAQSPFVKSIKSDKTGQFIQFQASGDGALAAMDCYLLAYGNLPGKADYVNIVLNFADYEDENRRVAKNYTFDIIDWKVDRVVSK